MNWLKLQFLALTVILSASGGLGTLSFFSDTEGPGAGHFEATLLDQEVAGQPIDGLLCNQVDRVNTVLYSGNVGPLAFGYGFKVENATGTFCGGLDARLINDTDGMLYDGPLLSLMTDGITLPGESADELHLELRLANGSTAVGTCTFDTSWFAMQLEGTDAPGFSDIETLSHLVSGSGTGIGGGCTATTTVNVYLEKHISGEDLGFSPSDFFYRIVGNGYDLIVPHDSYTPLPIGTYTIEELVPEGFVKEDWRIGWYGQCERGSTFVTSITIDEDNIDHGTLYCQADNQYRPAHGDNVTETAMTNEAPSALTNTGSDSSRRTTTSRDARGATTGSIVAGEEPTAPLPTESDTDAVLTAPETDTDAPPSTTDEVDDSADGGETTNDTAEEATDTSEPEATLATDSGDEE